MIRIPKPCTRCPLHKYRKRIVKGSGSIPADVLFLGEAPGKSESILGTAFAGVEGKFLRSMINEATEDEPTIHMAYMVSCRPTNERQGETREPTSEEVLACFPMLHKTMKIVKPKQIVFVGKIPEQYYKREYPEAVTIQHPAFLMKQGGRSSAYYLTNIRILSEVLDR